MDGSIIFAAVTTKKYRCTENVDVDDVDAEWAEILIP